MKSRAMRTFWRAAAMQRMLSWLIANYVRLVFRSKRWRTAGIDQSIAMVAAGQPFIVCFWHSRMLMMPALWGRRAPVAMLVSPHEDGKLIAKTIDRLGIRTIAGSTARGGTEALVTMVETLRAGGSVAVTPDGPAGPRMRAAGGPIAAAHAACVPIIPVAYSCTNAFQLATWDRLLIPLPFGRGVLEAGAAIAVPSDASREVRHALRQELEQRLNAITESCDRQCGREKTEPALMGRRPA